MKIAYGKLQGHLRNGLKGIYVVSGDEPLQHREACELIIETARSQGYDDHQILNADNALDWQQLGYLQQSQSLFAEKKIIDLRVDQGRPGSEGSKALLAYLSQPNRDCLLLVRLPFMNRKMASAKWYKSLEKVADVVTVWPPRDHEMTQWLQSRARKRHLEIHPDAARLIMHATEGNLLAADQWLERLSLDHDSGVLDLATVRSLMVDDAQFETNNLVKYLLQGDVRSVIRVWSHLRAMNEPLPLVVWVLADAFRQASRISDPDHSMPHGNIRQEWLGLYRQAAQRVPPSGWNRGLQELAELDRISKGVSGGDAWQALLKIVIGVTSRPSIWF